MVISTFYQSIGKAKLSMFLSLSRQLLFLLPMLIILPKYYGADGVWYSLPLSDIASAIVSITLMAIFIKRFNKRNKQQAL